MNFIQDRMLSPEWRKLTPQLEDILIQKMEQLRADPPALRMLLSLLYNIGFKSERILIELWELRREELQKPENEQDQKLLSKLRSTTFYLGGSILAPTKYLQEWLVFHPVEAKDIESIFLPTDRVPKFPYIPEINQVLLKVMQTSDHTWNRMKAAEYFLHIGLYTKEAKAVLHSILAQQVSFPEIKPIVQGILQKYP